MCFLNPNLSKSSKETFGLNTSKVPPNIKELKHLQDGLCEIAKNLEFRDVSNQFQNKLKDDLKEIQNEEKAVIPADKTRNYYKMEKDNYNELLNSNITKDYKKADDSLVKEITKEDRKMAERLEVADRM